MFSKKYYIVMSLQRLSLLVSLALTCFVSFFQHIYFISCLLAFISYKRARNHLQRMNVNSSWQHVPLNIADKDTTNLACFERNKNIPSLLLPYNLTRLNGKLSSLFNVSPNLNNDSQFYGAGETGPCTF